jgi:hypothetical protein
MDNASAYEAPLFRAQLRVASLSRDEALGLLGVGGTPSLPTAACEVVHWDYFQIGQGGNVAVVAMNSAKAAQHVRTINVVTMSGSEGRISCA